MSFNVSYNSALQFQYETICWQTARATIFKKKASILLYLYSLFPSYAIYHRHHLYMPTLMWNDLP